MIANPLKFISNWLEQRKLFYTINYRGARVKVSENPRTGTCEVCGKVCKTNRHHFLYAFARKDVLANPKLAVMYTREMCGFWPCHEIGNSIRKLTELDPSIKIVSGNHIIKTIVDMQNNAINQAKKDGNYPRKPVKTVIKRGK